MAYFQDGRVLLSCFNDENGNPFVNIYHARKCCILSLSTDFKNNITMGINVSASGYGFDQLNHLVKQSILTATTLNAPNIIAIVTALSMRLFDMHILS